MDRVRPTPDSGEFDMLAGWLAFHLAILLHKTNGLSDEQSRLCHPPSELTILGLVRHLAETERWWFRMIFAGEDIEPRWCDDSDRDRTSMCDIGGHAGRGRGCLPRGVRRLRSDHRSQQAGSTFGADANGQDR